jgi:site-specific recombinase XerD
MNEIEITTLPPVIVSTPRPADMNPATVYLASLAASGRRTQKQVLEVVAGWLGGRPEDIEWGALRYAHTAAIRTHVVEMYSPASARKILSALRGTLKAAWRLGQINAEEYAKAIDMGKVTGSSLPAGRYISDSEIAALFHACAVDQTMAGYRDAALLAILYGCGLRREEITNLDISDYRSEDGTLIIHGKRNKERTAYIANGTQTALQDWLEVRGVWPGSLFLAVNKWGHTREAGKLTPQAVYNIVVKRLKEAGLESFSPHSLRRSFVSRLLDSGVDIVTVAKLAGHSNVQTTQIYDRRPQEVARAGAATLSIPYEKRAPRE